MGMSRLEMLEKGLVDQYGEQVKAEIRDDGKEYGDPTPKAPPARIGKPSMADQIRQMIRREVSMRAEELEMESFEESDDFDVDDDPGDPHTPYEAVFDPQPPVMEKSDGDKPVDEGRDKPARARSGKSGKVDKNDTGSVKDADDESGSGQASSGDTGSTAKD